MVEVGTESRVGMSSSVHHWLAAISRVPGAEKKTIPAAILDKHLDMATALGCSRGMVEAREREPDRPADEVMMEAKTGGKVTEILVTLTSNVHRSLRRYADDAGTFMDDAARMLIESALSEKGFMEEE
jgi:hypothetical protein